jgi:hypothetical protein
MTRLLPFGSQADAGRPRRSFLRVVLPGSGAPA